MSVEEIETDLDAWWAVLKDYNESNDSKAVFQTLMGNINDNLNKLKEKNDAGDFDMMPASVKAKWVWAWQQLDAARDTVKADPEFMASLEWRP